MESQPERDDEQGSAEEGATLPPSSRVEEEPTLPPQSFAPPAIPRDDAQDAIPGGLVGGFVEEPTLPPSPIASDDATLPPAFAGDAKMSAQPQASSAPDMDTLPHFGPASIPGAMQYFGDYELLNEIARGGMGVVYRARQTSLNRIVALKMILSGQLAGQEEVQRFHAEAEAAANLDHPGIVPIYEVGEIEGQHYFSMGFVDGLSLSEMIAERPMNPEDAAGMMLKIVEAIGYAHEQGVIHRDLKPANVLVPKRLEGDSSTLRLGSALAKSGISPLAASSKSSMHSYTPRVTDFGLAKQVRGDDNLTASGQILGTPNYMPPEQAAGKIEMIDHRADIYSLGGILYALVTGHPPFQAANQLDTLMQVLERDPVPPRQLDPSLPRDIETIALKALEKDPKRRYQSAIEMGEDLHRFLNHEPILARSITPVERVWRWAKRKPVVASLGGFAAALLLLVAVGGPLAAIKQSSLRQLAESREEDAKIAQRKAERATKQEQQATKRAVDAGQALSEEKERAERTLYARTVALAYQAWHDDNVTRAEDLLNKTKFEYRDWEWHFVRQLCHAEQRTLRGHRGIPYRMQVSDDGKRMVSIGTIMSVQLSDPSVYFWDLESGMIEKRLGLRGFAISQDAKYVALERKEGGPISIFDVQSERDVTSIAGHRGGVKRANFSSNGLRLVTTGLDGRFRIWDTKSGDQVLEIVEEDEAGVHDVQFSPDDSLLFWKRRDGLIQIFDSETGKRLLEIEDRIYDKSSTAVVMSPDNSVLASAGNGPVHLFEPKTGRQIATLRGHRNAVLDLCFSPDGKRLASCSIDGTIRVWDVQERRELFRYRGHKRGLRNGVWSLRYSKDGQWLLSGGADHMIKIWPADGGDGFAREEILKSAEDVELVEAASVYPDPDQECDWLLGHREYIHAVDFSPDGKTIASAGKDDLIRLYDSESGQLIETLDEHKTDVAALAFSPDGTRLASGEGGRAATDNGKIFVWDLDTKEVLQKIDVPGGPVSDLAFDTSGEILYASSGSDVLAHRGEVAAWSLADGSLKFRKSDLSGVSDLAISADDTRLIAGTYFRVAHLLDAESGEEIRQFDLSSQGVPAVAFSPDDLHVVVGTRTGSVAMLSCETGEVLWERTDHSDAVTGLRYNPSGTRFFSVSADGSTRIWDPLSGDMLLDLRGDSFAMFDLDISPDGNTLVSYGQAPYVTVRRLKSSAIASFANASDSQVDGDQWPVVFADNFEREQIGDDWETKEGSWGIVDGVFQGELKPVEGSPVPGLAACSVTPNLWLPSMVEIEYEIKASEGVIFETKLTDEPEQNAIDSLFIAMSQPYFNQTHEGGAVLVQAEVQFSETARTGASKWFVPDKTHKIKTVRKRAVWEMFIDDQLVLQTEVPGSMWTPLLEIQCAFAPEGSTVSIDNLVIRAPAEVADEMVAAKLEHDLREKLKIQPMVLQAIQELESVSDSVRGLAMRYAIQSQQSRSDQIEILKEVLPAGELDGTFYEQLISVLKRQMDGGDNDWLYHQFVATAEYHTGQDAAAMNSLRSAEKMHQQQFAMSHPVNMSLLALVADRMQNQSRLRGALDRHRELMRSDHWSGDPYATTWRDLMTQSVVPTQTGDSALESDLEAIRWVTFEPMQKALTRFEADPYIDAYTDDAIHIEGRTSQSNSYDVRVGHEPWLAAERLFRSSAPPLHTSLVRSRADVVVDGDEARLKGQYTYTIDGFSSKRWEADVRLRRAQGTWKIYAERRGVTGFRMRSVTHVDSPDDWARLDRAVAERRDAGDELALADALFNAYRRTECVEVTQRAVETEDPVRPDSWSTLAFRAYSIWDAQEMMRAGNNAVKLYPGVGGPAFLRELSMKQNLPTKADDIGHGILVRMPGHVPVADVRDFMGTGEVLRGWFPTDGSGIVVSMDDKPNEKPLAEVMDDLETRMKTIANVNVYHKGFTTVAGQRAMELIFEGAGNGRTMIRTLGEPKGTVMRWLVVPRGDRIVHFLLTASPAEFEQRNGDFESWLRRIEFVNN